MYLTDLGREAAYRAAIARADGGTDLRHIRFAQGGRTRAELAAASDAVAQRTDLTVESVVVPPDGSGLMVRATDVAKAMTGLTGTSAGRPGTAVPVTVEAAKAGRDLTRLRDRPQWISGAALTEGADIPFEVWTCSSGLPARRNSDGRSFLITAGALLRRRGDGVHRLREQRPEQDRRGHHAGQLRRRHRDRHQQHRHDGEPRVDGPPGGPHQVLDVSGSAFSYAGDMTCQDGFTSGSVCGLLVNNGSVTWTGSNGVGHRGVEAQQVNGTTAARNADSGGLVFALKAGNIREARGIVSYGGGTVVRWTEAPYIFTAFGMTLAP